MIRAFSATAVLALSFTTIWGAALITPDPAHALTAAQKQALRDAVRAGELRRNLQIGKAYRSFKLEGLKPIPKPIPGPQCLSCPPNHLKLKRRLRRR